MSDTDDTDVLVLIPHDFFTVSSSEDEQVPRQHNNTVNTMSQENTPKKPSSLHDLTSPYKHTGDTYPKRTPDFRSPSKSEYTPQKPFRYSPSKGHYFKPDDNVTSPRYGTLPKSGVLSTYDGSSSRLRHSTSDLPTMSERQDSSGQRQRSLTGEIVLSGMQVNEPEPPKTLEVNNTVTDGDQQRGQWAPAKPAVAVRNPEHPDQEAPRNEERRDGNTEKTEEASGEAKKPQPYVGEHSDLPYVCGDNIGSIPDLGFGLRDFLASLKPSVPQSCPSPREPAHEPPCTKRYFSPLGGEAAAASLSGSRRQLTFDEHHVPHTDSKSERTSYVERAPEMRSERTSYVERAPEVRSERTSYVERAPEVRTERASYVDRTPDSRPGLVDQRTGYIERTPGYGGERSGFMKRPSAFVPVGPADSLPRVIGEPSSLPLGDVTGAARSPSVGLPSLSQLWRGEQWRERDDQWMGREEQGRSRDEQARGGVDPALLQQKLEEEKYRRMHCEQMISDLQQKLLRESERVAVATQVDARKDEYLGKLREKYEGTARHWQDERQRLLQDITEKNEMCAATIQRLRGCERELSKALDLASGFQQRSLSLEREKTEAEAALRARLVSLECQVSQQEQELLKLRAAAELSEEQDGKRGEQLAALHNTIEDEREGRRRLEEENRRLAREVNEGEARSLTLEAERDSQQAKLRDMRQRAEVLEQQKAALQQSLEELKKKERVARQEVRELSQSMEQSRQSLKEQYQAQLDQVVRTKLAEFQSQLDQAEATLRVQWEGREAEQRNKHARALSEAEQRHLAELRQVEERHTRDIAWWQRSLAQAMEQVQELTSELERQEKHREQLAGKIRSMLQAQYQQAANLIWEPPTTNGGSKPGPGDFKGWGSLPSMGHSTGKQQQAGGSTSEQQLGSELGRGQQHEQLKKYIEMLLQRPIGDPLLQDQGDPQGGDTSNHRPYIPELDLSKLSLPDNKPKSSKDNQKPPWK